MNILALIALLLIAPVYGPDDDEDAQSDSQVLALTEELQRNEALRYTPEYQTLYRSAARGKLHTSLGYSRTTAYFDADGNQQDLLGGAGGGHLSGLAWHIAGAYDVVTIRDMKLRLGGGFSMYQRQLEPDQDMPVIVEPEDSGLGFQNASFFGEILKPNYAFRTGFFYNFKRGQEPDEEAENSDGVHAMHFSVSGQKPTETFRFFGGADYYLTLRGRTLDVALDRTLEYAPGDIFHAHAGGGFRFGNTVEAGVTLLFQYNREGQYDGVRGGNLAGEEYDPSVAIALGAPNEFDTGWLLSAAPYVNYAPLELPLQFYVKGAVQREYNDYGFAIIGESEIAPRLGATFGVIYEL